MTMNISTQVTQMQPAFLDGNMVLGSVTVVVNFQSPDNYFGGQVVLTNTDDDISFTTTQDELQNLAISKAKSMIATSELPTQPGPEPEHQSQSETSTATQPEATQPETTAVQS